MDHGSADPTRGAGTDPRAPARRSHRALPRPRLRSGLPRADRRGRGLLQGAIYSNFVNKDELCLEVLQRIRFAKMAEIAATITDQLSIEANLTAVQDWAETTIGDQRRKALTPHANRWRSWQVTGRSSALCAPTTVSRAVTRTCLTSSSNEQAPDDAASGVAKRVRMQVEGAGVTVHQRGRRQGRHSSVSLRAWP